MERGGGGARPSDPHCENGTIERGPPPSLSPSLPPHFGTNFEFGRLEEDGNLMLPQQHGKKVGNCCPAVRKKIRSQKKES